MKCRACGCENEVNVTLCAQCGAELTPPAEPVVCCFCGKQIRPTAKYCVYCGGRQPDAKAEPVIPAEPVPGVEEAPETVVSQETEAQIAPEPDHEEEKPEILVSAAPAEAIEIPVPAPVVQTTAPACQLPTRRGLGKMILLGIVTCLLYPMVILSRISVEINMVASRYDGKRTIHFLWMPILGALTLGVYGFVWIHRLCGRIGDELGRRGITYRFGAGAFWLWNFLWGMLCGAVTAVAVLILLQVYHMQIVAYVVCAVGGILACVGPFVFTHKLMRATNLMNADYNEKG